MPDDSERPPCLSCIQAQEAIQRILERPGSIIFTRHVRERARERHFDDDDVYRVLERGTVNPNPSWDEKFGEWVYKISGRTLDGIVLVLKIRNKRR